MPARSSSPSASLFGLALIGLEIGTALRMGPGYFPLVLAGLLWLLGAGASSRRASATRRRRQPLGASRGGARADPPVPVVFGLTVRGLGLAPALALVVLHLRLRQPAHVGAAGARAGPRPDRCSASLVFSFGLGLPLRLFGPWLARLGADPMEDSSPISGSASRPRSARSTSLFCFVGVLLGTLVGVLPGIGPTATIAMLLPMTLRAVAGRPR